MAKTKVSEKSAVAENKAVELITKEVSPIVAEAEAIRISSQKEMKEATEMLSKANKMFDKVEEEREKVTVPLNQALKAENNRWKPIKTILETAIETLRGKIGAYQTAETKRAKEEADKIASRVKEGKGNLSFETASKKMEEIEKPDQIVVADSGAIKFRTDKVLKITNKRSTIMWLLEMNLDEMIEIDEQALKKAVIGGAKVDGCEIEEVQTPINTR